MTKRILGALIAPVFAFGIAACSVEQTEEGEAPAVDVEAGELPEYDVDAADVDVNADWDTTTVRTPDIDVDVDDPAADTTGV